VVSAGNTLRAWRPYGLLWLALAGVIAALVVPPNLAIAGYAPLLAVGIATLGGAVGLALLHLGILRYWTLGLPRDLCVGLAFGTHAVANLAIRVALPILGVELRASAVTVILLFTGSIAGALFLLGLRLGTGASGGDRRRLIRTLGALTLGTIVAAVMAVAFLISRDALPNVIDVPARQLLEEQAPIVDVLPGQAGWLVFANGALAGVMLLVAAGFIRCAVASTDLYDHVVAVALSLLAAGQLLALLFPPVDVDYVSLGGLFRLLAYLTLLFGLIARTGRDIAEQAAHVERLRLSRELHDGLAQHLGLLILLLSRAREPHRPPERVSRDLENATRLVEVAALEARQAIIALRSDTVTWDELRDAVGTFADDFARNHERSVEVQVSGDRPPNAIDAALRIEVLRIAHEACSNAVRHGLAERIEIRLTASGHWLDLSVYDDGRGFDPCGTAPGGVGLRSMRERVERHDGTLTVTSTPGGGATVLARLSLRPPRARAR
jgi:signal transduction histidine kinase